MMKRVLAAGVVLSGALLLAGGAQAQTMGSARGKVMDEGGQILTDVTVSLEFQGGVTQKYETKTNKKGEFTQVARPGTYRITFTKDGFAGTYIDTKISMGEPTYLPDIKLKPRAAGGGGGSNAADIAKANAEIKALIEQAEGQAKEGKYDEAIAGFQQLLTKNVSAPEEVHFRIGTLYASKKDWTNAEASYKKALELKPDHAGAQIELANVYQLSGQKDKATEAAAKVAAAGATDANAAFSTGVLHLNAGRYDEAQKAFEKTLELDPKHVEAHYYLGTIALGQNKMADAIAQLEKYLSLNPTNAQNKQTATDLIKTLKK
jgi:cytochrome c-type biogenesis protein CcmH/NrfG